MNNKKMMEELTARILEKMEKGVIPWIKPWVGSDGSWSRATGKKYSWLNTMLLDGGREYATYKQINEEGGKVLQGAKAKRIYFFNFIYFDENGKKCEHEDAVKTVPILKSYPVFDIENDTTLDVKHTENITKIDLPLKEDAKIQRLEELKSQYIEASGIKFCEKDGDRACYMPTDDSVALPLFEKFKSPEEYYSTLFHEFAHSTGHSARLNRLVNAKFGSGVYSREELVAEMTAAAILSSEGFDTEKTFDNSVAYIQSWAKVLKNDPAAIVWASSRAEKAYNFIKQGQIVEK